MGDHKPRLCHVTKASGGYGFHLHGEKGKFGQFIRKVEPDSPADTSGLKAGDRIVAVNGTNVENASHQEVVEKIKERADEASLLVVDEAADQYFQDNNIPITEDLVANGVQDEPAEKPAEDFKQEVEEVEQEAPVQQETKEEETSTQEHLRPRLCRMVKGDDGYGFNLHSDKTRKGRYIRAVDEGGAAEAAGVKAGDRLIEVNGTNMEYQKHADVVKAIKEAGGEVDLLVVDEEADKFFQSCDVTPSREHLTGPLPTPKAAAAPATSNVTFVPAAVRTLSPVASPTSNGSAQQSNGDDFMSMDLSALKAKGAGSSKKGKAPSSAWNNRQAIFNNL